MAKKFECRVCKTSYIVRKLNFNKNKNYKSGFENCCRACNKKRKKKYDDSLTDLQKSKNYLKQLESLKRRKADGRYKKQQDAYKIISNKRRRDKSKDLRFEMSVLRMTVNFYWEEKREVFIEDIKFWEW